MSAEPKYGIKSVAVGRQDLFRLPLDALHIKPDWNARDTETESYKAGIAELSRSIAIVGVKQPITVYWEDNKAFVSDGHRRYAAAKLAVANGAEVKSVPVQTEDRYSDEADRVFSQIVRNAGTPLTPMEQARVFKHLLDLGWSTDDISSKSGITAARVRQILDLLLMPEPVKEMVRSGDVSASHAATIVRQADTPAAAVKTLTDAREVAKAEGKSKVTPKHTGKLIGHARTAPIVPEPKVAKEIEVHLTTDVSEVKKAIEDVATASKDDVKAHEIMKEFFRAAKGVEMKIGAGIVNVEGILQPEQWAFLKGYFDVRD